MYINCFRRGSISTKKQVLVKYSVCLVLLFLLLQVSKVYLPLSPFSSKLFEKSNFVNKHGLISSDSEFERMYVFPEREIQLQVNCSSVINSTPNMASTYADMSVVEVGNTLKAEQLLDVTRDCAEYKQIRGYILNPLTQEEKEFPIAYSIMVFKDPGQAERLLRAIYRPQNMYCIHVDKKSEEPVYRSMNALAKCFNNVFLSKQIDVWWGEMSLLFANLFCMRDLYNRYSTWKYYINLTGQEFPLKSNAEIVKWLKSLNGTNDVQLEKSFENRWTDAGTPPYGLTPKKGSTLVAITREFANYTLHDVRANALLIWLMKTLLPDETFFNTLNYNPQLQAPGAYKGNQTEEIPMLIKAVNWHGRNWECHGQIVHDLCIVGVGELPILVRRPEMFVNKLYWDYQPVALECLDEWLYNKTKSSYYQSRK